jgi:hypothetical protein
MLEYGSLTHDRHSVKSNDLRPNERTEFYFHQQLYALLQVEQKLVGLENALVLVKVCLIPVSMQQIERISLLQLYSHDAITIFAS